MSHEFFVSHDYGQGGLWAIVLAGSAEQVRRRFPALQVFDVAPRNLSAETVAAIRAAGMQSIDARPIQGWLAEFDK
jgi:cystathionine beta-lyase/cystathionine gamma-synthase